MSCSSRCGALERHAITRRVCLAGLAGWTLPAPATPSRSAPPEVAAELPAARLVGHGRLRYLGLLVYDAWLWSASLLGHDYASHRIALELRYARTLRGAAIAERSLAEMRRVGGPIAVPRAQRWLAFMTQTFPDVADGDRITGVQWPGEAARFYVNGVGPAELRDADFPALFFGIWLSPRSSEPALRQALLGPVS
jgi:hypothetical protein